MKALVVDDSKIVRKVTRNMLEPMGFTVDEADDGLKSVEYCKQVMPALILMDHTMPELNGLDAIKIIRQLPGGDQPVIMMCTTMNELDFIQRSLVEGANEYVMKPFNAEILQDKLEQLGVLPLRAAR